MTNASDEPIDGANEADVIEQRQEVDGAGTLTPPDVSPAEANEADVLEQGANVDPEDDAYPHLSEQSDDDA